MRRKLSIISNFDTDWHQFLYSVYMLENPTSHALCVNYPEEGREFCVVWCGWQCSWLIFPHLAHCTLLLFTWLSYKLIGFMDYIICFWTKLIKSSKRCNNSFVSTPKIAGLLLLKRNNNEQMTSQIFLCNIWQDGVAAIRRSLVMIQLLKSLK